MRFFLTLLNDKDFDVDSAVTILEGCFDPDTHSTTLHAMNMPMGINSLDDSCSFVDDFVPAGSDNEDLVSRTMISTLLHSPLDLLHFPAQRDYAMSLQSTLLCSISLSVQGTHKKRRIDQRITTRSQKKKTHTHTHTKSPPLPRKFQTSALPITNQTHSTQHE